MSTKSKSKYLKWQNPEQKYLVKGETFQLYKLSNLNKSILFLLYSCRKLDGSESDLQDVLYGLS